MRYQQMEERKPQPHPLIRKGRIVIKIGFFAAVIGASAAVSTVAIGIDTLKKRAQDAQKARKKAKLVKRMVNMR